MTTFWLRRTPPPWIIFAGPCEDESLALTDCCVKDAPSCEDSSDGELPCEKMFVRGMLRVLLAWLWSFCGDLMLLLRTTLAFFSMSLVMSLNRE